MKRSTQERLMAVLRAVNQGAVLPSRLCWHTEIVYRDVLTYLDKLIATGHVEKIPTPQNRRSKYMLRTTAKGQQTIMLHEQLTKALSEPDD